MSELSSIEPAKKSWFARLSWDKKALAVICVLAVSYSQVIEWEPREPQVCENVGVLGTVRCGRGGQCFVVRSFETGIQRRVGTFANKPFGVDYIGPAALFTRRGAWTGAYHFEFRDSCAMPPNKSMQ